jgi:hypothetical protein
MVTDQLTTLARCIERHQPPMKLFQLFHQYNRDLSPIGALEVAVDKLAKEAERRGAIQDHVRVLCPKYRALVEEFITGSKQSLQSFLDENAAEMRRAARAAALDTALAVVGCRRCRQNSRVCRAYDVGELETTAEATADTVALDRWLLEHRADEFQAAIREETKTRRQLLGYYYDGITFESLGAARKQFAPPPVWPWQE